MLNLKNSVPLYSKIAVRKLLRVFGCNLKSNYRPLYECFHYTKTTKTKHALLAYRVLHVRTRAAQTWSYGDVHDMIQVLSEMGYKTDVLHHDDATFIPSKPYDVFIGHPGYCFQRIESLLSKKTPRILFYPTAYWKYQNAQEQTALQSLPKETRSLLHSERHLSQNEDVLLDRADGIILLSNDLGQQTFPQCYQPKIQRLETATFLQEKRLLNLTTKNFASAKYNFLFYSGSGNVLRGLFHVLDAFTHLKEYQLFISTKLEKDFGSIFNDPLFHQSNIHYIGQTKAYSKRFFELMRSCNTLIYPSFSEGSPGAVADCMAQGLIPIVSRTAHIDVANLGRSIDPGATAQIIKNVRDIAQRDETWHKQQSSSIQQYAKRAFSQKKFRDRFRKFIDEIIANKRYA